jgi:hypothetical protein
MKLVVAILITLMLTDPGKISQINSLKSQAKKAFQSGDYKTAIEKYRYLTDSLAVTEDEVRLNLANALFQQHDTTEALNLYQQLNSSADIKIRSRASQQMGVMNNRQGRFEEALSNFKQAIKSDPANQDARFNYEMLKKKLEEKKKQEEQQKQNQQQDKNKDQKNEQQKDQQKKNEQQKQQEQDNKDKEQKGDKKDEDKKNEKQDQQKKEEQQQQDQQKNSEEKKKTPPSVSEKLEQMKISEQKAKMLLEAMKNQEIQYLQQNKRKATKPKDKGKPDW